MDRCRRQCMVLVVYVHYGDGTIRHGLTMDFAKGGSSICERTSYACIAHLDKKASEREGEGYNSLIDRHVFDASKRHSMD